MRKQRFLMLVISFVLLAAGIFCSAVYHETMIMGLSRIDESEYNQITKTHERMWMDFTLYLNEMELEFVYHDNMYMIPQSIDSDVWSGKLTYKSDFDVKVYLVTPELDKKSLISSNAECKIVFISDDVYDVRNVRFTGTSLVILNTLDVDNEMSYGTFRIIETQAGNRNGVLSVDQADCRFHLRGASSATSEKKAYKLNLLDEQGNALKKSFLGMRDDNDWILNPMYFDESEMKEMISYDIWNTLSSRFQHKMEYVELVLDGKYNGIYCLQEPVDLKTFRLNESDSFLFSVKNWYGTVQDGYLYSDDLAINLNGGYTIVDDFKVNQYSTDMVMDIVNVLRIVKNHVMNADSNENVVLKFDSDNVIEYTVFLNLVQASDNAYKNQKVAVNKLNDNEYAVYKTPWDLDWVMFTGDQRRVILKDEIYFGDDHLEEEIKELYNQCRDTFYTVEKMHQLIDSYKDFLINSGSAERESKRWEQDFNLACEQLKEFFELRIPYLDAYYGYGGNNGISQ